MFSSVFEKVVSTTAPDALATFPLRAALPIPPSTLCCLSFADWFLWHYPVVSIPKIDEYGNDVNLRLVGRAEVSGVAVSAHELDSVMQNAAKLGCRLAPALAGTSWSRPRESRTVPVFDLLAKVRGIFGNRLTCVGRDIRLMRNAKAEKDENLLLRQIHTLRNAALDTCNGQKWCLVVSSGGESLVVCSVPLPPTEVEGKYGCDFLVFDPWPRPKMKLQGSYIVKFTTVRGLQLHLLSALGEIWREGDRANQSAIKDEFVLLSVVMDVRRPEQENFNTEARCLLEESVTRLRKAEKAAAIKIKREEVEALRRALEESKQKHMTNAEPVAGRGIEWKDGGSEKQGGARSDLFAGSASSYSIGRSECLRETPEYNSGGVDFPKRDEVSTIQATETSEPDIAISTTEPARIIVASSGHIEVEDEQNRGNNLRIPGDRYDLTDPPQRRPLVVGISPPLTARRSAVGRRWTGESWEEYEEHGRDLRPVTEPRNEQVSRPETQGAKAGHIERVGGAETSDDPFNRALLRSVEGEALADYSKRAYKVCRANGIIQYSALDINPTPVPWRASSLVEACSFGSATPSPVVSAPAASTVRGVDERLGLDNVERGCQVIQEGDGEGKVSSPTVQRESFPTSVGREAIQHSDTFPVDGGLDEAPWVDSAAANCSVGDGDLCIVDDVSAPEKAVSHAILIASRPPSEKMRLRLQAPSAGRALASASSNAREGSTCSRKEFNAPQLDLSGNSLPPAPHVPKLSVRTRKMWNDDGSLRSTSGDRRVSCPAKREELLFGEVTGNSDLVAGENITTDRLALVSPPGGCSRHSMTTNEIKRGGFGDALRSTLGAAERNGNDSPTVESPQQKKAENSQGREVSSSPVDSKKDECSARTHKSKSRRGRTDHEYRIAERGDHTRKMEKVTESLAVSPRPTYSPRVKHRKYYLHCDDPQMATKTGMPSLVTVQGDAGVVSDHIGHVPPTVPDAKRTGSKAESTERRIDDAFVWFGQPDSPACHPSTESVEVVAAVRAAGPPSRGQTSVFQHQRSKAKFLLKMDVQRQRNIIECAFRARERARRIRRSKLGAEVVMKFHALRHDAKPKKLSSQKHKLLHHADQQADERAGGEIVPKMTALRNGQKRVIGAKGPEFVAEPVETAPIRVGTKETGEWTEARRPGDATEHKSPNEPEPQNTAGDPFIRFESRKDHGGMSATMASAPPPVSFEVTADEITGLGTGRGGIREQTRRKKRLEILRAKKAVEAKERQRVQKERQAAAKKEEQQKSTTDTASERCIKYADGQIHRQTLACHDRGTTDEHETTVNDRHARGSSLSEKAISSRMWDTNGSSTARAPKEAGKVKSGGAWGEAKMAPLEFPRDSSPAVRGLSRRSNRQLVRNAINFLCLAGGHVQDKKSRVLEALDSHRGLNFVLLLAHNNLLAFKGLYACSGEGDDIAERLCGVGPPQINVTMVSGFYKYNSAAREFREVHSKTLGKTTDAVSVEPTKFLRSNGKSKL